MNKSAWKYITTNRKTINHESVSLKQMLQLSEPKYAPVNHNILAYSQITNIAKPCDTPNHDVHKTSII